MGQSCPETNAAAKYESVKKSGVKLLRLWPQWQVCAPNCLRILYTMSNLARSTPDPLALSHLASQTGVPEEAYFEGEWSEGTQRYQRA
jgi:hypothetical protein